MKNYIRGEGPPADGGQALIIYIESGKNVNSTVCSFTVGLKNVQYSICSEKSENLADNHKVRIYTVCPLVGIGTLPTPPHSEPVGVHTRLRVRGGGVPIATTGEKA